jgi:serine/threonine protein kinase
MDLTEGTLINGVFRVERILKGGMGVVYICDTLGKSEESPDELEVLYKSVWKSFHSSRVWDGQTIARFEREALLWISLPRHPNIVKASTFQRAGRQCMLLLEYIDGGNLRDRLLQGPITLPEVISFCSQFCNGIDFLHRYAQIIHRDIKPENILLTKDKIVKITDLGLSRLSQTETPEDDEATPEDEEDAKETGSRGDFKTKIGAVVGTIPYLAPEQFLEADMSSEYSDQYSFGVVLYELLSGRRPFWGRTLEEYREQIVNSTPRSLAGVCDNPALVRLVNRCLSKSASDRFESFGAIHEALTQVADEAGLLAHVFPPVDFAKLEAESTEFDWTSRGYSLAKLGKLEDSLKCYRRAHELAPDLVNTNTNMAVALGRLGQPAEALPFDQKATELARKAEVPENIDAYAFLSLANTLARLKRADEAYQVSKEAATRYPDNFTVLKQLVLAASNRDDWAERDAGLAKLKRIYENDPDYDNPISVCTDGVEFAQANFWEEAKDMLEYATTRYPDSSICWYNLGVLCHRCDEVEEAIHYYTRAIDIGPPTVFAYVNRGLLFAGSDRWSDAVSDWKKARELDAEHPAAQLTTMFMLLGREAPILNLQSTIIFEL